MAKENKGYDFDNYKKDALTKPRDIAWDNWAKFEKVGDKVQGFIRDVFYRKAEGLYKEQRGITLEQPDGVLINVGIKRLPFVLAGTDNLRIGDPLTVELIELKASSTKGFSATKIFGFFGTNLPENASGKTVAELDREDALAGGTSEAELDKKAEEFFDSIDENNPGGLPFEGSQD